ncbi:MAG: 30S ribosomal protein S16 [Planctomycetota bacterium]
MAVRIRLSRAGRTHKPFYHIGVYDIRQRREGAYIDKIGFYDPTNMDEGKQLLVDVEKAAKWLAQGAKPSDTVASILVKSGVELPTKKGHSKPKRKRAPRREGRKVKVRTKSRGKKPAAKVEAAAAE